MARPEQPDPLLLQTVSARLARLLAETEPTRNEEQGTDGARAAGPLPEPPPATPLDVEPLPEAPRFRRVHVAVVAVLLLAGVLWSGWSLFRARPVALATAPTVAVSTVGSAPSADHASDSGGHPRGATAPASSRSSPGAGPGAPAAPRVVVHVLGAVRSPGLVTLPAQARVQDAVDAAGGLTRGADPGQLNLAQVLQDGQQVLIGTRRHPDGEVRSNSGPSGGTPGAGASPPGGAVLDLNQADAAQLEELPGVGPVTAAAILAWRTEHGRFTKVDELQEVDGIGPKTYAQIAPHVRV